MTTLTELVPSYLDVTRLAVASFLARYREPTLTAYTQDLKAYLGWCQTYDRDVVRPASWIRPAGVSPVWVGTGTLSSRPRFVVERRRAERGVKSLFGGSKITGRSESELCSLVRPTMGEPSRSCHGEGHVRQALFRGQPGGSLRGRGDGT